MMDRGRIHMKFSRWGVLSFLFLAFAVTDSFVQRNTVWAQDIKDELDALEDFPEDDLSELAKSPSKAPSAPSAPADSLPADFDTPEVVEGGLKTEAANPPP